MFFDKFLKLLVYELKNDTIKNKNDYEEFFLKLRNLRFVFLIFLSLPTLESPNVVFLDLFKSRAIYLNLLTRIDLPSSVRKYDKQKGLK